jgi:uncharacterized protein (TIGR04222 family)
LKLTDHLALWNKIQLFSLDDEKATISFSRKLQHAQNWSPAFTKTAIEEYRKFILLCCISEKGAAPSHTVDEVWHLHLTYTESYWINFCRNTLCRDVHHYPSAGGEQEDRVHQVWYQETLQLYRSVFGYDAPVAIWPPPALVSEVLEEPSFHWTARETASITVLLVLPFLVSAMAWHTVIPFNLKGPEFLIFFPVYGVAVIAVYSVHRYWVNRKIEEITRTHFSSDANAFQVANFLYGKHRAMQAVIVDLLKRNLLELQDDNRFIIKSNRYVPGPGDTNPLLPILAQAPDGSRESYESLLFNWYEPSAFAHPALDLLTEFAKRRESNRSLYIFHYAFFAMFILRMMQGMYNGRPVGFLVMEMIPLLFLFSILTKQFSRAGLVYRKAKKLYKELLQKEAGPSGGPADAIVPQFALSGLPALSGFAEGLLLVSVFGKYASNNFLENVHVWNNDSSSSGGSSCSGGGSCGGGGCGGCGGGH